MDYNPKYTKSPTIIKSHSYYDEDSKMDGVHEVIFNVLILGFSSLKKKISQKIS